MHSTIKVYFRPKRHSLPHYRIMKDATQTRCHIQSIHSALEAGKEISVKESQKWSKELDREFDQFIRSYRLSACKNITDCFVALKPSQIESLKRMSEERRKDFEYLTKTDITSMLATMKHY